MRVLIADDSDVSRRLLARLCESWGYDVVQAADGVEAWQVLQGDDAPMLAILDWVMPKVDGIEVCRRLRATPEGRRVFVYLLTARSSTEDMMAGLEAGANDYIIKPFSHAELEVRLRNGRRMVELHQELVTAREALRTQAMVDALTQLWNRRAFMELAGKELARASRQERSTSALMIDVDHFKKLNDTYGHAAGDEALKEIADRIKDALRTGDHLGRYGGEELVALLPDCGVPGAYAVAERVRRAVRRTALRLQAGDVPVSVSIGAASARHGRLEDLLERADQALYQAKREGRDRAVLSMQAELKDTGS